MPRGRKSQPDQVNEAKGNPGRRKRKVVPVLPASSGGEAPKFLTTIAKKIWDGIAPDLATMRFIRSTDYMAFARYCEHLSKWWELTLDIQKNGETCLTESEHVVMERIRPAFMVRERIEKHLIDLEDRFGLNPVSRQQLLQRMAMVIPQTPSEGLFNNEKKADATGAGISEPTPPSAVGLLRQNGGALH